jgi:hypothetical protein
MDLQRTLHKIFLSSPENLFDAFIKEAAEFYALPAHTLQEMRTRENKKIRGDIFEEFCALYLKHVSGYEDVWLLKDVPEEILTQLSMKRRDMGIDLVVRHRGEFYAIQSKYKKYEPLKKTYITWKALSTFYALCMRTGPWKKYIVMTNCNYACHQGKKTEADVSICLGTFRNISSDNWLRMCSIPVEEVIAPSLTSDELRQKRLAFYSSVLK